LLRGNGGNEEIDQKVETKIVFPKNYLKIKQFFTPSYFFQSKAAAVDAISPDPPSNSIGPTARNSHQSTTDITEQGRLAKNWKKKSHQRGVGGRGEGELSAWPASNSEVGRGERNSFLLFLCPITSTMKCHL